MNQIITDPMMMGMPQVGYGGILPGQADISLAEKRWESDDLEWNIAKILGMRMARDNNGNIEYVPIPGTTPIMNQEGVHTVIMTIRTHVNPVVVLSKLDDEEAKVMIRQANDDLMELLVLEQENFGLKSEKLNFVYGCLRNLIRAQIMRARDGHESKNNKTQIVEQSGHSVSETRNQGGFNLFPGRRQSQ